MEGVPSVIHYTLCDGGGVVRGYARVFALEAIHALIEEILPGTYGKTLAIDNTSAEAMLAGGPGSQRTRHLKIRANYVREAVEEGRMRIRHVSGQGQLADLATKMQPRLRLHQLLRLWGFMGSCLVETLQVMKLCVVMILAMISSLVCPSRAQLQDFKEPVKAAGWDELALFLLFVGLITIVCWEFFKWGAACVYKTLKAQRKKRKMQEVGEIAAKAARQAIKEQMSGRRSMSSSSSYRLPDLPTLSAEVPFEEPNPRTPTLRRRSSEARVHSSPDVSSQASTDTNVLDEPVGERKRVAHDMISLMTLEEIKVGLRAELLPVSGLKSNLVPRLAEKLNLEVGTDHRVLATVKQMKYVLWRAKDLSGRARIRWADVNNRSRISMWIQSWKNG